MNNTELLKSLMKAQTEIKAPFKDKVNPRFKSSYASWDSICNAIKDPLTRNGLQLSHSIEEKEGKMWMVATLFHCSGESISNKMPIALDLSSIQSCGSAWTYGKRYTTCALLLLQADDDDDGEVAENPPMSDSQVKEVMKLIGVNDPLLQRILKGYGKESLKEIPASEFAPMCARLTALNAKNEAK